MTLIIGYHSIMTCIIIILLWHVIIGYHSIMTCNNMCNMTCMLSFYYDM